MTHEDAAQILGPETTARIDARAAQFPPLTRAQLTLCAGLLRDTDDDQPTAAVA